MAEQSLTTGSVDIKDALISAGTAYLGSEVWDKISPQVQDAVGAAEGDRLSKLVDQYEASGKYSAETIAKMREEVCLKRRLALSVGLTLVAP